MCLCVCLLSLVFSYLISIKWIDLKNSNHHPFPETNPLVSVKDDLHNFIQRDIFRSGHFFYSITQRIHFHIEFLIWKQDEHKDSEVETQERRFLCPQNHSISGSFCLFPLTAYYTLPPCWYTPRPHMWCVCDHVDPMFRD